jgi:glutamate-1-semialdehyde 2,1-aminomutase
VAEELLVRALTTTRTPGVVNRVGSMMTLFLGVDRVRNHAEATAADTSRFGAYFRNMLAQGIYLPPSQFEAMFVSLAHDEQHIEQLGRAAARALAQA